MQELSKNELLQMRKDLVEAYKKEHQELFEEWWPRIKDRSGLDADYDYRAEERKIERVFQKKLEEINANIRAVK